MVLGWFKYFVFWVLIPIPTGPKGEQSQEGAQLWVGWWRICIDV